MGLSNTHFMCENKFMNIGKRIKNRRTDLGITQVRLAELVGVSQNAIHKLEDGTTKQPRSLSKLAKVLKCEPNWLLFGVDEIGAGVSLANFERGPKIRGCFPLISWVQAGDWKNISEIDLVETVKYPCPVSCSDRTFILRVQGVSMYPDFKNNELIFVDPEAEWRNGSYVVVRRNDKNEATFKQLIEEDGEKFLKPSNPNWPNQIIHIDENCEIVGTVIFAGRLF